MLAFNFVSRTFSYRGLAHEVSADICLLFQVSCASNWIKLLELTKVLSTWTTLKLQPTMLRTLPGPFARSSSAFAERDWSWQSKNAISESDKLSSLEERFHQKNLSTSSETHILVDKLRFPNSKKALQRDLGSVNYYRDYIQRMAGKLYPFYNLPKAEVPINITSETKETFDSVKKPLNDACELALKQPFSETARLNDGCMFQKCWICPCDWRQYRSKDTVKAEKIHPRGVWPRNYFPARNSKCPYTGENFWQFTWYFFSLYTFCWKE